VGKTAFDASRFSGFWLDPEELVIIDDPKDPLYDARAKLTANDALVRNISHFGVLEPVMVTRRGSSGVVVDGRQRVRAAREANKRLKEAGLELVKVPCILKAGDDAHLFGILCTANEHRLGDTPLEKAKKAARLRDMGRSEEEIAVTFGVSKSAVVNWLTVVNWLKMLDLPAAVRKEVEAGHISAAAALKLRDEEPEKAVAAVKAAVAKSEKVGGKKSKKRAVARALDEKPRMKSRKQIEERLALPSLPPDYTKALKWTLGMED
jgi:ParB family chromosome partitioning protein